MFVMEGWGSRTGSTRMDTYEYRNGSLNLIREMGVSDDLSRYGYNVMVENERLVGVPLPDYYYILLEAEGEEEWGNLYYEGLIEKEGILCHVIGMGSKTGGDVFWVNDATGEITAKVPFNEKK